MMDDGAQPREAVAMKKRGWTEHALEIDSAFQLG